MSATPGSVVVSVFAGTPIPDSQMTEWDARCGFRSARTAMAVRRAEDEEAVAAIRGSPRHLDLLDAQYERHRPTSVRLQALIAGELERAGSRRILYPLGLLHSDHILVSDACLSLAHERPEIDWIAYEDAPYHARQSRVLERLTQLREAGFRPRPFLPQRTGLLEAKRRAVAAYRSQLGALASQGYADIFVTERYWRIERPS